MRDENQQQSPSSDELDTNQRSMEGSKDSRRETRTDEATSSGRWVPLAYDLEQNGDHAREHRGEVF